MPPSSPRRPALTALLVLLATTPLFAQTTLEKAFIGIGGRSAIENLESVTIDAGGQRATINEGITPLDGTLNSTTFGRRVQLDLAGNRMRIDWNRMMAFWGFTDVRVTSEILNGQLGHVAGRESLFNPPPPGGPIDSDRWSAIRKQEWLLNPHWILRDVALGQRTATDAGDETFQGRPHHRLMVTDPVFPMFVWIDQESWTISAVTTMEADTLLRDLPIFSVFNDWRDFGGVKFPIEAGLGLGEWFLHFERRAAIRINESYPDQLFDFPPGGEDPVYDSTLADRGLRRSQWNHRYGSIGVIMSGYNNAFREIRNLAPGVWWLAGQTHNTMVAEQDDRVIVLDTPIDDEYSSAVLDWIADTIPGKPVTHAITTHHHTDHAAGFREYAARGITVIAAEDTVPFFSNVIVPAASTIMPDRLSTEGDTPTFMGVPKEGILRLDSTMNPVEVHHVPGSHSADMLVPYLPNDRIAFTADLYNPFVGTPPAIFELLYYLMFNGVKVDVFAGGHGGVATYDQFIQEIGFYPLFVGGFRVAIIAQWHNQHTGERGVGIPLPISSNFGLVSFGDPWNPEIFVKLVDHGMFLPFEIYWGAMTDFEVTLIFQNFCSGQTLFAFKPAGSFGGGALYDMYPACAPFGEAEKGGFADNEQAQAFKNAVHNRSNGVAVASGEVGVELGWVNPIDGSVAPGFGIQFGPYSSFFATSDPFAPDVMVKGLDWGEEHNYLLFHGGITPLEYTATFTRLCDGESVSMAKEYGELNGGLDKSLPSECP